MTTPITSNVTAVTPNARIERAPAEALQMQRPPPPEQKPLFGQDLFMPWGKGPLLPPGKFPFPPRAPELEKLEKRFLNAHGRVNADEARQLLREAMKDGKIGAAEMAFLQNRANAPTYRHLGGNNGWDEDAKAVLKNVTDHASKPSESWGETSDAMQSIADSYRGADGKIDVGEARALMDEAVSSGRALTRDEIGFLRGVAQDARTTPEARTELYKLINSVERPFILGLLGGIGSVFSGW